MSEYEAEDRRGRYWCDFNMRDRQGGFIALVPRHHALQPGEDIELFDGEGTTLIVKTLRVTPSLRQQFQVAHCGLLLDETPAGRST